MTSYIRVFYILHSISIHTQSIFSEIHTDSGGVKLAKFRRFTISKWQPTGNSISPLDQNLHLASYVTILYTSKHLYKYIFCIHNYWPPLASHKQHANGLFLTNSQSYSLVSVLVVQPAAQIKHFIDPQCFQLLTHDVCITPAIRHHYPNPQVLLCVIFVLTKATSIPTAEPRNFLSRGVLGFNSFCWHEGATHIMRGPENWWLPRGTLKATNALNRLLIIPRQWNIQWLLSWL